MAGCDRNLLRPVFTALNNSSKIWHIKDYSYLLPVTSIYVAHPVSLNYVAIGAHIICVAIVIADFVYINIFASNHLFFLYTLSVANDALNVFAITATLATLVMFAAHVMIMSPFLFPLSRLKYADRTYWLLILKSFVLKSVVTCTLFSISPLLLLYLVLCAFIVGNAPTHYFKPNMQAFHDFHVYLHQVIIPDLLRHLNGSGYSRRWVHQFAYLLFNCMILDEYLAKKAAPQNQSRVSFINMLAGNDVDKLLHRVKQSLQTLMHAYNEHGGCTLPTLRLNHESWTTSTHAWFSVQQSRQRILYNFKFLIGVVYLAHLALFWTYYFVLLPTTSLSGASCIATLHAAFILASLALLYLHMHYTVLRKPQCLYTWSNYYLMDFYCSMHDDDEQDSFKTKLLVYATAIRSEIEVACAIRQCLRAEYAMLADDIIAFVALVNEKHYEAHPFNTMMHIVSRRTHDERHYRSMSSKQDMLRQSMHVRFGTSTHSVNLSCASHSDMSTDHAAVLVRRWSSERDLTMHSQQQQQQQSASHHHEFSAIEEERSDRRSYDSMNDDESKGSCKAPLFPQTHHIQHAVDNELFEEKEMNVDGTYKPELELLEAEDNEDEDDYQDQAPLHVPIKKSANDAAEESANI
mmetsp:Transcript_24364/g.39224  ORF Transcript_24364/g.39224 Transcript_24364/m.39224 type:complete len:633 (+) Transcript_24364:41-1939(+)